MGSKFLIDEQTKKDIQLINSSRKNLFDFFNKTKTERGDRLLGYLFYSPTTDIEEIRTRQSKIKRLLPFSNYNFNFDRLVLKDIDKFLASSDVLSLSVLYDVKENLFFAFEGATRLDAAMDITLPDSYTRKTIFGWTFNIHWDGVMTSISQYLGEFVLT